MKYYKFQNNDIFYNVVEANPAQEFIIHDRELYYQKKGADSIGQNGFLYYGNFLINNSVIFTKYPYPNSQSSDGSVYSDISGLDMTKNIALLHLDEESGSAPLESAQGFSVDTSSYAIGGGSWTQGAGGPINNATLFQGRGGWGVGGINDAIPTGSSFWMTYWDYRDNASWQISGFNTTVSRGFGTGTNRVYHQYGRNANTGHIGGRLAAQTFSASFQTNVDPQEWAFNVIAVDNVTTSSARLRIWEHIGFDDEEGILIGESTRTVQVDNTNFAGPSAIPWLIGGEHPAASNTALSDNRMAEVAIFDGDYPGDSVRQAIYARQSGLYDAGRAATTPYYFISKNSSLSAFKTISTSEFNSDFAYGDILSQSSAKSASIKIDKFQQDSARKKINALQNTFNYYGRWSQHFLYSSSYGNKAVQEMTLISVPSIFYGSLIEKGSVSLKFFYSGTLIGELKDDKYNGELRQSYPEDDNSGSIAGVALYNEGFFVLTGSWDLNTLNSDKFDPYQTSTNVNPKWIYFATTGSATVSDETGVPSASFSINFQGNQKIPSISMMAHAKKGELNFSNNPTFIDYNSRTSNFPLTNSFEYKENANLNIKNVRKSQFSQATASFNNETYISQVGIYDKNKNLIGIAKLANPVRKREIDSFTFKLKFDI